MGSLGKKQSVAAGSSGSLGLLVGLLVGMGGGRVGNTDGPEDSQSSSESNTEPEGRVWDLERGAGKAGAVLVAVGKSSSKVTHCWTGFPVGGGSWRRGARVGGARGREERAGDGSGAAGPNREAVRLSWGAGAAGVGTSCCVRADVVLWRLRAAAGRWRLKSGVRERCCCWARGPVKGLVLLGRAGSWVEAGKGPGEARSVSWERLRAGTGGGGGSREEAPGDGVDSEEEDEDEAKGCRSARAEDCREKEAGSVPEEGPGGTEGGARRDEPLVRDWVASQGEEEEDRKSDVRASKGSGFHCASLWIPFRPLV